MFINYAYYQKIQSADLKSVSMHEHTKRYFSDLHAMYGKPFDIKQTDLFYSYVDTASYLFDDACNQTIGAEAEYLFFPSWGWVLDTHCTAPEFYLKNKFKWRASILDIRDCGSLCVYYALYLVLNLSKNAKISGSAVCSIENAYQLVDDSKERVFPEINYVALLSLSAEKKSTFNIEIIHCDIFNYEIDENNQKQLSDTILRIAHQYGFLESQCHVVMREIDKAIWLLENTTLIMHPVSSGFLYEVLSQIYRGELIINSEYVFIIDFDLKAKRCGVLLSKMLG
jgi:hypothetical protein